MVPGQARVPYRDSKLTRILQDSLGGNCKCAIVVTIRCEKENIDEAINTLRFAQVAAAPPPNRRRRLRPSLSPPPPPPPRPLAASRPRRDLGVIAPPRAPRSAPRT
jgi:hypothetical protein